MIECAKVLGYVSRFSTLIPIALIFFDTTKIKGKYFPWLGLLIAISLLTDVVGMILTSWTSVLASNALLENFYDIAQFILLGLIYLEFYLDEEKKTIAFAMLIYFVFEIVNSLFFQSLRVNQTWSWAFSALILFCLSVGYFNYLLKTDPVYTITKFGPFWINVAVLLYFGFSLYLFVMAEFVFTKMEPDSAIVFWSFHNLNNILKNIIFAVGIHRLSAK